MKVSIRLVVVAACMACCSLSTMSCSPKPNDSELSRLEESRLAAENAEKKLAELKTERMQLEKALADKQAELKQIESQRDSLKQKLGE